MPLIAMNDHVDGLDDLKLVGYGIPTPYPLGMNGFGDTPYSESELNTIWQSYISAHPNFRSISGVYALRIDSFLSDGDVKGAYLLMVNQGVLPKPVSTMVTQPSQPADTGSTYSIYTKDGPKYGVPPAVVAASSGKWGTSPAATFNFTPKDSATTAPAGGLQKNVDTFVNAFKQIFETAAPAFKRGGKGKTVIQKDPDYTTYAVIGGAVIVASVLAIAVGKSGRKRD